MNIIRQLEKFDYVALLISTGAARSTRELAAKLNVSQRQVKTYIQVMRKLEYPIAYSRNQGYFMKKI